MKNELEDYISRNNFDDRLGVESERLAREAFAKMDNQLDLSIIFPKALEAAHISELSLEFSVQLEKVKEKSSVLLEGKQWSRVDGVLYFEDRRCVPESRVLPLLVWLHENHGHPQISRLLPLFRRQFYTKLTDVKLKEIYSRLVRKPSKIVHRT